MVVVSNYYPVEELLKFLHEQLHSAGLHCPVKRAIEELKHKENENVTRGLIFGIVEV